MHTDNYNTTACLPDACFNQIYLKLGGRDKRKNENEESGDGP